VLAAGATVVPGVVTVADPAGVVVVVEVAGVVNTGPPLDVVVVVLFVVVSSSAHATLEAARTEHKAKACKVDFFIKA